MPEIYNGRCLIVIHAFFELKNQEKMSRFVTAKKPGKE